jgi:integrase
MTDKKWKQEEHDLFDGDCKIFTTSKSNGIYQLQIWLRNEGKTYRRSLRTKHLQTAIQKGKEEFINITSRVNSGKQVFSEDVTTVVNRFLTFRQQDVETGSIVKERLGTIKTHLKNMLMYLSGDMKVGDIHRGTFIDYYNWRKKETDYKIGDDTIRNEYSTIRMFIKYCHREGLTEITPEKIEIKKFDRVKLQGNVRRDTFTEEEWEKLYIGMRTYCSKKNCDSEIEYYNRQIFRNYILALSNTGMRTGELEQLRWSDILDYRKEERYGDTKEIVFIQVRGETSKVQKNRRLFCRDSLCFRRVEELSKHRSKDDLVFSSFNGTRLTGRQKNVFWYGLIDFCKINTESRNITFYSLRHFYVTQRWKGGVRLRDIANSCGTSVNQIEKTYYHLDEDTLIQTALKDDRRIDRKLK